jgi:hypothetical protein
MRPYCQAINCRKTSKDGVTLHQFPKNLHYRRLWTTFVQTKRADFQIPNEGKGLLCSDHFTEDQFENYNQFYVYKTANYLVIKETAVPTIHKLIPSTRSTPTTTTTTPTSAGSGVKRVATEQYEGTPRSSKRSSSYIHKKRLAEVSLRNLPMCNDMFT